MSTNLFGGRPNAVVAKSTISFASAGITAENMSIIYLVDTQLLSYVPGRPINGVTGFENGKGYFLYPIVDMDLSSVLIPPISGAGDVTAPSIVSAIAVSATSIQVVFSENVLTTGVAGWTFNNGGAITPSAVSGSGTNTLTFTVAGLATGQTITRTYNQGTGDTRDAAGNELAAFTNGAVTNSIAGGPVFVAWDDITSTQNEQFNSNKGIRKQTSPNGAFPATTWSTDTIAEGNMFQFILDTPSTNVFYAWLAKAQDTDNYATSLFCINVNFNMTNRSKNVTQSDLVAAANGDRVLFMYKDGKLLSAYSKDGGSTFTTFYISYIDPEAAYFFAFLGGTNGEGLSEVSKLSAVLMPPLNFRCVPASAGSAVNLSWDASSGGTGYQVQRATAADFTTGLTTIYTGAGFSFNDTGLTNGTTYYYRIKATGATTSPWYKNSAVPVAGGKSYLPFTITGTRIEPFQNYKGARLTSGFTTGDTGYAYSPVTIGVGEAVALRIDDTAENIFSCGLTTSNAVDPFTAGIIAMGLNSSISVYETATPVSSGNAATVGHYWRIAWNLDNTLTVDKSTDSGGTWTTIYTSGITPTGTYVFGFKPTAEGFGSSDIYKITL